MNDNDQLDDGAVLSAVRKAVSQLPLATAPGPQVITARGRARLGNSRLPVTSLSIGQIAGATRPLVRAWRKAGVAPPPASQTNVGAPSSSPHLP